MLVKGVGLGQESLEVHSKTETSHPMQYYGVKSSQRRRGFKVGWNSTRPDSERHICVYEASPGISTTGTIKRWRRDRRDGRLSKLL